MKTCWRLLIVVIAFLCLYEILAVLYQPCATGLATVTTVRKYAWLSGVAVAGVCVVLETKLHLTKPRGTLCPRCIKRDKAAAILLTASLVLHLLSAFAMPNEAEVFSPIFLLAAMLDSLDVVQGISRFLNETISLLDYNSLFVDVFILQQMLFAGAFYWAFGRWYRSKGEKI